MNLRVSSQASAVIVMMAVIVGCTRQPIRVVKEPVEVVRVVKEPVRVEVPVPVTMLPPAALLDAIPAPGPHGEVFIAPCSELERATFRALAARHNESVPPAIAETCTASSALTREGEVELRRWIDTLYLRIEAWEAWADWSTVP